MLYINVLQSFFGTRQLEWLILLLKQNTNSAITLSFSEETAMKMRNFVVLSCVYPGVVLNGFVMW